MIAFQVDITKPHFRQTIKPVQLHLWNYFKVHRGDDDRAIDESLFEIFA